jgi:anti-anti-sigma factor
VDTDDLTIFDVYPIHDDGGSIGVSHHDGVAILDLDGEFDVYAASPLRERCRAELAAGRACVVDLRDAAFVDSAVLAALLDARRRSRQLGRRLVLVLPEGRHPVRRAMDAARLEFERCADLAEAVRAASLLRRSRDDGTALRSAVPD